MEPGWELEDLPDQIVLVDRGRNTSYAKVPRDENHVLGGTSEIEQNRVRLIGTGRVGRYKRDRDRGPRYMTREVSRLGKVPEALPIAHDDESPSLQVLGASRATSRMEDPRDVFIGYGFVRELSHHPDAVYRVPDLHVDDSEASRLEGGTPSRAPASSGGQEPGRIRRSLRTGRNWRFL